MKESKFQKKEVNNFLNYLKKNEEWIETRGYKYPRLNESEIVNYIFSLEKRNFIALISSPYWNNYPSWSNSYASPKRYGNMVAKLLRETINSSNTIRRLFVKRSSGLWQRYALEFLEGSERIACAKRGIKSKDKRVRLKSVEIVPNNFLVKNIKSLLSDSHKAISWKLMKRLGPDNYAHIAMEYSSCSWTKRDAIKRNLAGKDVTIDSILFEIDKLRSITDDTAYRSKKYQQRSLIAAMANKTKASDAPYLLAEAISDDIGFGFEATVKSRLKLMKWAQD